MKGHNESEILLPLTAKEKAVLEFIEQYLQARGIAPSYQEIREHFGLASFNSVQRYLQQLQNKKYIYVPGGNLKRAITVLRSSNEIQSSLSQGMVPRLNPNPTSSYSIQSQHEREAPPPSLATESLSLPLLGRVAAGRPLEAMEHNEFISVPATMIRNPNKTYVLRVQGESMIEDGIFDGDLILVQRQENAKNGDTVVAMVNNQATVKRFYLQTVNKTADVIHEYPQGSAQLIELRPANAQMQSLWYEPNQVHIQGLVVGLLRQYV
ncbi:MAG: transcriptional repressor LexA [Bdellovibrionales bacterium]